MTDDQLRNSQLKDVFEFGDEDTQEVARFDLLTSGTLPIEEAIPYLDLASCLTPGHHIRWTAGAARRSRVHRTRWSEAHKRRMKSWNAIRSRERFINQKLRSRNENRKANMPVIARSIPRALPPCGPAKCQIMRVDSGRSSKKEVPYFELALKDLASGLTFKESLYLSASCAWKVEAACRSAGLTLPDGEFRLVPDDFENRVIFGNIVHKTLPMNGKKVAELKSFWSQEHAVKQNPALADIPDPENTPEPMTLPVAKAKPAEPQQTIARAMQIASPVELSDAAILGL